MAATKTGRLDLNQVSTFVRVVDAGSFTAAARTLGLPKSSVSRRVSALEGALRVRLLQRSTRKLVLTEAGRLYFERARAALGGLADASATVTDMSRDVAGPIRFTAAGDSTGMLAGLIGEFLARHPKVQLDVVLTPRRVDLVAEGFDLGAARPGRLVDSSLVGAPAGRGSISACSPRGPTCARPGGPPASPSWRSHRCILLRGGQRARQLRLTGPGGEETVAIDGPLVVHEMSFAVDAIVAGIGIGLVPEILTSAGRGRAGWAVPADLVRVLPEYGVIGAELSLVSPHEVLRAGAGEAAARLSHQQAAPDDAGLRARRGGGQGRPGQERKTARTATVPAARRRNRRRPTVGLRVGRACRPRWRWRPARPRCGGGGCTWRRAPSGPASRS